MGIIYVLRWLRKPEHPSHIFSFPCFAGSQIPLTLGFWLVTGFTTFRSFSPLASRSSSTF